MSESNILQAVSGGDKDKHVEVEQVADEVDLDVCFVLPEEVWEIVLSNVTEPEDIRSCYHTYPLWGSLLERSKYIWHFQLLFPILFPYLPKAEILKLRQICQAWKNTVDNYLETDQFYLYNSTTNYNKIKLVHMNFGDRDDRDTILERFRTAMRGSPGNPIIGRSVSTPHYQNILPFFDDFGAHIWHADLWLMPDVGTSADFYSDLLYVLLTTPDLCTFKVLTWLNRDGGRDPNEVEQLPVLLAVMPPPPLPYLTSLQLRLFDNFSNNRCTQLIYERFLSSYAPQLETLFHDSPNPFPDPMPNLYDLSIMIRSPDQLEHFYLITGPVEVLDLNIHTSQINLRRLFRAIEHFRATLRVLSIQFFENDRPNRLIFGQSVQFPKRLNLPFLEELTLKEINARSDMCWDFLKTLRSLRRLEVWFKSYTQIDDFPRERERILFNKYLDEHGKVIGCDIYFSNIWYCLPNLQKLSILRIDHMYRGVFSRNMHNHVQEYVQKQVIRQLISME